MTKPITQQDIDHAIQEIDRVDEYNRERRKRQRQVTITATCCCGGAIELVADGPLIVQNGVPCSDCARTYTVICSIRDQEGI